MVFKSGHKLIGRQQDAHKYQPKYSTGETDVHRKTQELDEEEQTEIE